MRFARPWLVVAAIAIALMSATAAEQSNAVRFLEAMGIRELLEKQRAAGVDGSRDMVQAMVAQLRAQTPNLSESQAAEMERIVQDGLDAVQNSYTVDEAIQVYAGPFARNYPAEQLDQAIAQFSSPEGKRMLLTVNEGVTVTTQFMLGRQREAFDREMPRMMERIRRLAEGPPR